MRQGGPQAQHHHLCQEFLSFSGLGFDGEGYTTMTIATPTGEGVTSARSFTRLRRCVLYGDFRIC